MLLWLSSQPYQLVILNQLERNIIQATSQILTKKPYNPFASNENTDKSQTDQIQIEDNVRLNEYIEELEKELELERKSRQLLTDDLANVCKISLKKENIIKEVREYIENLKTYPYLEKYYVKDILEIIE